MSGVDIAARGLAKRALDNSALQGLSPSAYGAVGDGVTADDAAFSALMAALVTTSEKTVLLESKTYVLENGGGLTWAQSNASLIGRGIDRSIIRQTNHAITTGSALQIESCNNVLFQDLTLHGADSFGALYVEQGQTIENITFNRVKFTSDPQSAIDNHWFSATNGIRWVCDTGSARNIWLIDCIFENCGRMGIEFQNHGAGATMRIGNVHIIRPRFVDIGQANASDGGSAGMGVSLSGNIDNILIDQPYFDNVDQICVELVGASRTKIRDMVVRHDTLGTGVVAATNNRPMYGNEIDGLRWVGPNGVDILADIPVVATHFRLDNFHQGVLRNCHLNVTGSAAILMGVNYASSGNLIENNILKTDQPNVISMVSCPDNTVRGNHIETTSASGGVVLVGAYGDGSTNCLIDGNSFAAENAANWVPLGTTGAGTAKFTPSNILRGKKMTASGWLVIPAGQSYGYVDHELGESPAVHYVTPRQRVSSGGVDRSWFSDFNNVILNVNTNAALDVAVAFHWHAQLTFGNL